MKAAARSLFAVGVLACACACTQRPRHLDDRDAVLSEPLHFWSEDLGSVAFTEGRALRSPRKVETWFQLSPDALDCDVTQLAFWIAYSLQDSDEVRPADNTEEGRPVYLQEPGTGLPATRGWVRVDARDERTVTGAMSWVAEDEQGEPLAWAEGAFTVPICTADF